MSLTVKTGSKINLSLDITGLRPDGYHLLSSVMQTIDLYDDITLEESSDISIKCNLPFIPADSSNIAYKAAKLFFELSGINSGVSITLNKNVPVCAGMGGGSANGAGVLLGLNELFSSPLTSEILKENSVKLGADVPLFLQGGTMLCTGIGEQIENIGKIPNCFIVILKDGEGVSTKEAYKAYDSLSLKTDYSSGTVEAIKKNSLNLLEKSMGNVLFDVSKKISPSITRNIEILNSYGAKALMTGSGSAVFGLFADETDAINCYNKEKNSHHRAVFATPTDKGIIICK